MENANDEFTWLSGPAHQSIVQEAQSRDTDKGSPKAKPLPHPRQHNAQSEPSNCGMGLPDRPTPVPRAAPRTTSKPVYEVPPSLPNSVFYVATPKTSTSLDQRSPQTVPRVNESVIMEFDPIYRNCNSTNRQSASVFYVSSVAGSIPKKDALPSGSSAGLASGQGSVLSISSDSASGSGRKTKNFGNSSHRQCLNSSSISQRNHVIPHSPNLNSAKVSRSASSSSSFAYLSRNSVLPTTSRTALTNPEECPVLYSAPDHDQIRSSRDISSDLNTINVSRSTSSSSSLSYLPRDSTLYLTSFCPSDPRNRETTSALTTPVLTQVSTPATTSLPKNYCVAIDAAVGIIDANAGNSTQQSPSHTLPPLHGNLLSSGPVENSISSGKRVTPIPKPRKCDAVKITSLESLPRTEKTNLKCTLSTVPPPPLPYVQQQMETGHRSTVRESSISVENPFYMLIEGGGAGTVIGGSYSDLQSDSESLSGSSGSSSDFETPPPAFPPPPLPAVDSSGFPPNLFKGTPEIFADLLGSHNIVELSVDTSSVQMQNGDTIENLVEIEPPSSRKEDVAPIYQNLMGLYNSAREGVYAKINKLSRPTVAEVPAPPPLPPRKQQQQVPALVYPHPAQIVRQKSNEGDATDAVASQRKSILENWQELSVNHHGVLFKIGRGRKDIVQYWIQLESGSLLCYADAMQDCLQEMFHKSSIISIAKGTSSKLNQELSCFELAVQSKDRVQVFGARYLSECEVWVKLIVQTLAPRTTGVSSRGVIKAGKVEVRNSVTGMWQRGWLVLCGKRLEVCIRDEVPVTLDLRKVILLQDFDKDPRMSDSDDGSPIFLVNYPAISLYVRTTKSFDTYDWSLRIRKIINDTGPGLDEQQLTHDDVPVIIYKCIEFVSTYGMNSQGIYRQSATNSRIAKLLDSFRKDAQGVRLQQGVDGDSFTEHEVANALKRYLRTLPDSLLTSALYQRWIAVAAAGSSAIENLVVLLQQLPEINYQTLKKIVAHLYSISRHSDENLMTITNLAQVFGPTLFSDNDENIPNAHLEMDITSCLITNYPVLFKVSAEEIEKEEQFQKALRDLREAKKAQKPAGDILVGVYIHDRHWGKCLNIKLSPTMTALNLCNYVMSLTCIRDTIQSLSVFEIVCNGHLERPLHFSENVLSVILRWASWADADAKDNYLLIKRNEMFPKIVPLTRQPLSMFGELRFADNKSKNFKKMMFEFKNARLAYYKDAKISEPLVMWNIEDITWYIGVESRRPPPNNNLPGLSLTFIEHSAIIKRGSKECPYFGHTISFSLEEEFFKWMAAMLAGQYPTGILPRYEPLNLL